MKGWKKVIATGAVASAFLFGACGGGDGSSSSGGGQTLADICMRKVEAQLSEAKAIKFSYLASLQGKTGEEFELLAVGGGEMTVYAQEDALSVELSYAAAEGEYSVLYCLTDGAVYQKYADEDSYQKIDVLPEGLPVTFTEGFEGLFSQVELGEGEFFNALSDYATANGTRENDSIVLTVERSMEEESLVGEISSAFVFEKSVGLHSAVLSLSLQETVAGGAYDWFGQAVQTPSEIKTAFMFELSEINTQGSLGEITVFEYPLASRIDFAYVFERKTAVVKTADWEVLDGQVGKIYRFTLKLNYDGSEYNYVIEGAAEKGEVEELAVRVVGYKRIEQNRETGMSELSASRLAFTIAIDWENKTIDFTPLQIKKFWTGNY